MLKFLIVFSVVLLSGCALWTSDNSEGPVPMEVSVDYKSRHRCSRISPEIDLYGVPAGTTEFEVKLEDILDPRRFHGGGQWPNDNSGVIPEGALTRRYSGPCPPGSGSREYQYVVKAKDATGNTITEKSYKLHAE